MKTIGTILGFLIGAGVAELSGALLGAAVGFLAAHVIQASRGSRAPGRTAAPDDLLRRVGDLEVRMMLLEARLRKSHPDPVAVDASPASPADLASSNARDEEASPAPTTQQPTGVFTETQPVGVEAGAAPVSSEPVEHAPAASASGAGRPRGSSRPDPLWAFLTGGNAPVRIGIIVLFFGVAFLLKYVAERVTVPIELRLAGVAVGGIVLLVIGWKLRTKREAYGLVLEGGGIGVLYLTVFTALKLYTLLPPPLAFALLVAIAAFSALLALRQNALALAITGTIGGFLAPILAATGSGNHVVLFSYYAVLDAGILFIAWHKAWGLLNLLGFAFTALVGMAWGARSWQPELLASTEPFLIFFFLLFVAVSILYAMRRSLALKHYVDGTLVFGVPIVAFGMQSPMMRHIEFGAALSAVALSGFYLGVARLLYRKQRNSLQLLLESFVALAVVFATLAIPLALDGRWTSAAWALEGAAVFWAGQRQDRKLARAFGIAMQPLAAIALIYGWIDQPDALPILNSGCLGGMILAVSGWFVSYRMTMRDADPTPIERAAAPCLFVWASLWWLGGGLIEIDRLYSGATEHDFERIFVAFSLVAMALVGRRLDWHAARVSTLAGPVLLALHALGVAYSMQHPFVGAGWLTWPLAITAAYWALRRHEDEAYPHLVAALHVGLAWTLLALGTWELDWQLGLAGGGAWRYVSWALLPAIALHLAAAQRPASHWPLARWAWAYRGIASTPIAALLWLWGVVIGASAEGSARPLPYLPVLNPIDLTIAAIVLAWLRWTRVLRERAWLQRDGLTPVRVSALLGTLVFAWLNGSLLRTIHHYADVPHQLDAMMSSVLVQAALSLFWSLAGVALMTLATRWSRRALWFVGVALMVAVVAKLFLVDLSGVETVERIVSFIGVGLLLLAVGYIAPMPPAELNRMKESDA